MRIIGSGSIEGRPIGP